MENKQTNGWKIVAILMMVLALTVTGLYATEVRKNKKAPDTDTTVVEPVEEDLTFLTLWNEDAKAKNELEAFVKDVTDENSANFVPVENRVAVFDLDGTLFCETDPVYFDHMLLKYRVEQDPGHEPTELELKAVAGVQEFIDTGVYPEGLDNLHGQGVASAFSGMTIKEFYEYVRKFGKTPCPGYNNMNIGDAFYLPMLEVIEYLQDNDFEVYIVSGTDRLIVRGAASGVDFLNIPANHIIGSDELIVASNQGDTDGLEYVYSSDDDLILAGEFIVKNLKMNKVTVIQQEIGVQPILSFGNSSGDYSMANYTVMNNPYRSMAFMLCCDDTVRENGNTEKAEKMAKACEENGWVAISMKNDWKTIYGDEVTRKQ